MKIGMGLRAVLFLFLIVFSVSAEELSSRPKVLKIGAVLALGGNASVHGNNIKNGLELAKRDLESRGWLVDLAYEDDETQPAKTVSAIHALTARGYNLLIGPTWSYQVESAISVIERQNALSYCPATSSIVVGQKSANVFHGISFGEVMLGPVVAWLQANSIKRVAIVYADCVWGEVHSKLYQEATKRVGATLVTQEKFSYGEEESALPILVTRMKAKAPDVILTTGSAQSSAMIVKKLKELNAKIKVMSTDDMQDAVEQRLVNVEDKSIPKIYALIAKIDQRFRDKYRETYSAEAGIYADSAYDGLMIMAEAVGNTDGSTEQVQEYLHQKLNYQGYSGRFDFDDNGDTQKTTFFVRSFN